MGFLNSIARTSPAASEARGAQPTPMHPRDPGLVSLFEDQANPSVTVNSAMRVTAVYACVSLIAETLAALPLHVMLRTGDTNADSQKAKGHKLYKLLHDMPAPGITSFEWREMLFSHTALNGDSYARIVTNGGGDIEALPPLLPSRVVPEWSRSGRVQYRHYKKNGGVEILFDDEVLRIPHKMLDGITSMSPIKTHRETIGNAMVSTRFINQLLRNQAQPKGALMTDAVLGAPAAKELRESWEERHQGPHNAGRIAILDGGMKWEQIGMSLEDAQYIELQKFSVRDIARIYLVPPHKIADLDNATFSNIEHQAIEFVVDTILRWTRRAEMRFNAYLLSESERLEGYFIAFDLKGLLAGDSQARSNFYKALFYIGSMSPNEIRAAENMAPYPGGDRFYLQGANVPVEKIDETIVRMLERETEKRQKNEDTPEA